VDGGSGGSIRRATLGRDDLARPNASGIPLEVALAECGQLSQLGIDQFVPDVAPVAARLDVAAEAQAGDMRCDARLWAAQVPDDLSSGLRSVVKELKDLHARGVR
jgi:hypothetical protein